MKKTYYIILAVLVIAGIGAYIGITKFRELTPDVVNKKPDAALKVTELIAAFEKDTASASEMYIDKIVEITGNVKTVDTSGAIVLGEEGSPSEVVVGLDRRHMKDFEKVQPGKEAVIQGVCSGYTAASTDPDDMLASLGTTVQFRSAGVKKKN